MIQWIYYPRSAEPTSMVLKVVKAFEAVAEAIDSPTHIKQESNDVLSKVAYHLSKAGFKPDQIIEPNPAY